MKRFVLYLLLVPIIAPLVTGALQAVMSGGNPFSLALRLPGYFLWLAYFNWLVPALGIATADWLLRSDKWQRLWTIAAAGYVSAFLTDAALYGLFPRGLAMGEVIARSDRRDCCTRLLLVTRSIEQRTLKQIRLGDPQRDQSSQAMAQSSGRMRTSRCCALSAVPGIDRNDRNRRVIGEVGMAAAHKA